MNLRVITFGRKNAEFTTEIDRYISLCRPFAPVAIDILKPPAAASADRVSQLRKEETIMRSRWPAQAYCVALSEEGKLMDSRQFSRWLSQRMQSGRELVFCIGGAYGLSATLKHDCRETLSLSPLTFAHRLALVALVEQLYRAFTILKGHPYHKE